MGVGSVLDEFLADRKTVDLPSKWQRFLTVNVIFSPEGKVVRQGPTGEPEFNMNSPLFAGDADVRIWNDNANAWGIENYGVTAMTFFSLEEVMRLTSHDDVEEYMADKSAFVAINLYTGQLFPRE
jgi:glycine cleavage system aminomethyltransferase T